MNFGKAKKILIFLFAFLNLFLIFQLSHLSDSRTTLSAESIKKTVQLVSSRGLTVSEEVIPRKIEILNFLQLSNPLYEKDNFISNLNSHQKADATNKYFIINYNGEKFQNEKDLLKFLNKSGFSPYAFKFANKISNPITNEEVYTYYQSYLNHFIYGSSLNALIRDGGLFSVSASLFEIEEVKMNDYTPVSPLQILLSLSRSLNGKKAEVKKISQAYFIPPESKDYQNLTAIPCYILEVNFNKFIYDAQKGEFMYCISQNGNYISEIEQAL